MFYPFFFVYEPGFVIRQQSLEQKSAAATTINNGATPHGSCGSKDSRAFSLKYNWKILTSIINLFIIIDQLFSYNT